ncbi:MAG: flap endonuclease-1 [Candidatus Verstraetearchaeota archaeon]|nr:flap endonuclease-1 [Candidatus Verstraetearchaeota archaeon]
MGVNLRDLVTPVAVSLEELKGKVVAIDGYNALYQFLAIIRQPDGTPLKDSRGRITSHLSGIFYRTANLLEAGVKPVYVFDGKPPELKTKEIEKRIEVKERAAVEYKAALERGDMVAARKAAQATSKLTGEMVGQAKDVLVALGVPWIQAPSEGEAQATFMTKKGDAWATVSQDYDSLLFGAPRLIRNLTISGRRKLPNKPVYIDIEPEIVRLEDVLLELKITRDQLIDIGILLGTDFNPDGFKGIGPKKALKAIEEFGSLKAALEQKKVEADPTLDVEAIRDIFLNPKTTDDYRLEWGGINGNAVKEILCGSFDFSPERIEAALHRIEKETKELKKQSSLEKWF